MSTETATAAIFLFFAAVAVVLAVGVVTSRRILRAAVCLAGVLVSTAAFYLLLGMEFLAGVQVLIYVGGIVVLLVYAVMLTSAANFVEERPAPRRKLVAGAVALAFFGLSVAAISATEFPVNPDAARPESDVAAIGRGLLDTGPDGYVLPFELISLLLLAAVIGGVVVARKRGAPTADPAADEPEAAAR
jgi:NADH-quinone oxidoreductase subunit J